MLFQASDAVELELYVERRSRPRRAEGWAAHEMGGKSK